MPTLLLLAVVHEGHQSRLRRHDRCGVATSRRRSPVIIERMNVCVCVSVSVCDCMRGMQRCLHTCASDIKASKTCSEHALVHIKMCENAPRHTLINTHIINTH